MAGQRILAAKEIAALGARAAKPGELVTYGKNGPSQEARDRLRKLEEWLENERLRQATPRYQMAIDEDFYDGLQISDEDALELVSRGQAPLVYNKVKPMIDWLTGTERRTRVDFKVYPRSSNDRDDAENKTKLLKYVQDVNKSAYARSRAFDDAMKAGIGWLECGIRADPTQFIIYDRYENWRNMLHDSYGAELDCRDWRYQIRRRWTDTDIAIAMYPQFREALEANATYNDFEQSSEDDDEWYLGQRLSESNEVMLPSRRTMVDSSGNLFNRRSRNRLYEMWYRYPAQGLYMQGGPLSGLMFDPAEEYHLWLAQQQSCAVIERVAMTMRVAVFIKGTLMYDSLSPYRHQDFPFTPIWANRRARDGTPYGPTRNVRDPQEDLNRRMQKALYALSTRRIVMDDNAVEDIEDLREEAARPDSIIAKKAGSELVLTVDTEIAEEHMKYAQFDAMMIEQGSGVTDELLGRKTNAVSGVAIEKRQDQGSTTTTRYFDNYRLAFQIHGQKLLSLCEQYITFPMSVRIIGERAGYDFVEINKVQMDQQGQPTLMGDVTKAQADFVVSAQDFRDTMRQAAFESLMDLTGKLAQADPQIALQLIDDVLEMADIPNAEQLIKSIRQITGKQPADHQPTPEEEQAAQAEAQQQAFMKQLALKGAVAEVEEKVSKIRQNNAQAAKYAAEAQAAGAPDGAANAALQKIRDDTAKLVQALREQVQSAQFKAALAGAGNDTKERIARLQAATSVRVAEIGAEAKGDVAIMDNAHEAEMAATEFEREQFASGQDFHRDLAKGAIEHQRTTAVQAADQAAAAGTQQRDHGHDIRVRNLERFHDAKAQERDLAAQRESQQTDIAAQREARTADQAFQSKAAAGAQKHEAALTKVKQGGAEKLAKIKTKPAAKPAAKRSGK